MSYKMCFPKILCHISGGSEHWQNIHNELYEGWRNLKEFWTRSIMNLILCSIHLSGHSIWGLTELIDLKILLPLHQSMAHRSFSMEYRIFLFDMENCIETVLFSFTFNLLLRNQFETSDIVLFTVPLLQRIFVSSAKRTVLPFRIAKGHVIYV